MLRACRSACASHGRGPVVLDDAIIALADKAGAFACRTPLTIEALRDEPLVCLPRGTGVRAALDDACQAAGFTPHVVFEASALSMVVHLACLGLGTGIVPASAAQLLQSRTHITQIALPGVRSRLELVWAAGKATRPAARALIEHARRYAARLGDTIPQPTG